MCFGKNIWNLLYQAEFPWTSFRQNLSDGFSKSLDAFRKCSAMDETPPMLVILCFHDLAPNLLEKIKPMTIW